MSFGDGNLHEKVEKLEACLDANERELWALTVSHDKLVDFVQERLWPRASMTMGAELRSEMADELFELGCEVEA